MLELSNTIELRREGPLSWFRATRKNDDATVILKTIDLSSLPTEDVEALQQKIRAVQQLDDVPEVNAWAVEHLPGKLRLVTQNPAGSTLKELIGAKGRLELSDIITIAATSADALKKLHDRRIVLCNLSPESILIDEKTLNAGFFDLDAALIADQRRISTDFGGTRLEYISPEQTGRTSRKVQAGSDLYSLGVILYECLTGNPPFTASDPMQIIHGHIASKPKSPAQLDPKIPDVISAIVDKLLAKEPGDRYLSARGLSADLSRCREMLAENGKIAWFDIGEMDEHALITVPRCLYGRSTEVQFLKDLLTKTQDGSAEFIFVEGPSGIGKTALIETVADQVKASNKGSFVSGKFDQLFNMPYKAFFECFAALIQQLLAQDPRRLADLRQELLEALAGSGQLLIETVPDLEMVLGEQPPLEDLPPTERENRFRLICRQFFQVFASEDHPLTVFIDDLQWADAASLNLIEYLISDPGSRYIYFIGAHRPQATAALSRFKEAVAKLDQTNIHHIYLTQLSVEEVRQFLMETLGVQDENLIRDLAEICFDKTQGNPFFLQQFLLSLSEGNLIGFDYALHRWEWQIDKIKQLPVHEDVALLFAERLQLLSPDTLNLLQWGACLGNRFETEALASIENIAVEQVRNGLRDVIRQGLLLEASPRRLDNAKPSAAMDSTLRFAHDRILEAVYTTLREDARSCRHFKIGKFLETQITSKESDETVFSTLNQLIRGFDHIHDHPEPRKLAQRFLSGAQRAKSKAAYELGLAYLKHGISLLPSGSWNSDYELSYSFHLEQMEAEYLNGNFHVADRLFDILKKNSRNTIEKLNAYNLNVQMLTYMTKFSEAIASGTEGLKLNGINIASPFLPTFLAEVLRARRSVKKLGVENFSSLPKLDNPDIEKSLEIMNSLATPTFLTDKNLFVINGLKMFNLTMRHGMSVYGPNSIMMYGVVNSAAFSNYDAAYDVAVPSMQLGKANNTSSLGMGRIYFVEGMLINWLKRPLEESIKLFEEGLTYSWASADLAYVGYHHFGIMRALFSSGAPLRRIKRKLEEFEPEAVRLHSDELTTTMQTLERYLFHTTQDHPEFRLTEKDLDLERSMVSDQGIGVFCLCYSHLATIFDDVDLNARMLAKLEEMDEYVTTGFYYVDYLFQFSLHLARIIPRSNAKEARKIQKKLKRLSAKLDKIALSAGDAQAHKAALVQAEIQRLSRSFDTAMMRYDEAISIARNNGSYDVCAIAAERAAEANFERGRRTVAQSYMREAITFYQEWGATAKVSRLRHQHRELIDSQARPDLQPSSHQVLSNLDMASVLKASQAISGTIMQDELLQNLLTIVIENVGAQRGLVLLLSKGELIVEAEGRSDWAEIKNYHGRTVDDHGELGDIPAKVVRYVERKRDVLVLDNASVEAPFNKDAYFQNKPPCSVLCAPILLRGELIGIIYLENALSTGAFTPDRSAVLEILCSQAAISIKNASLYSDMKGLNKAYERFVPQQFISLLEKESITDVELADHVQRQMTIMFLDVRDFTTMSERMDPKESFEFINALLGEMDPIIRQHGGFIDKYLGDGIMALFPTGASDAVSSSIEILKAIDQFNDRRKQSGSEPVRIGIGVHTGVMMLGTIGGQDRMDGTVISSAVNLASRLESLNKVYGSSILISEDACNQLGQNRTKFDLHEIDRVSVKGMSESVTVFEVKGAAQPSEPPIQNDFA